MSGNQKLNTCQVDGKGPARLLCRCQASTLPLHALIARGGSCAGSSRTWISILYLQKSGENEDFMLLERYMTLSWRAQSYEQPIPRTSKERDLVTVRRARWNNDEPFTDVSQKIKLIYEWKDKEEALEETERHTRVNFGGLERIRLVWKSVYLCQTLPTCLSSFFSWFWGRCRHFAVRGRTKVLRPLAGIWDKSRSECGCVSRFSCTKMH